jgi:diacylglycerol kinase
MSHQPQRRAVSRVRSFGHAFEGVWYALRTQPNARIHLLATLAVIGLGLWLGLSPIDWAILCLAIGLVWTAELLNTGLEALTDLASPDIHPLAKATKDVAAAAVLMSSLAAAAAGLFVLGPPLLVRLGLV